MSKHEAMQKNCPTSSIYGRAGDHPSASHMPPAAAMNGFQPAGDPDSGLSPLRTPARQTRVESRELSMADRATDPSPPRTVSPCCPHPPGFTPLRHLATEPGPRAPLSPRPLLLPLASPAGEEASPGGGAGARGAPFAPDTHPALPWEAARAPAAPRDAGSSPAEAAPWRRAAPHPGAAPSSAHAPNRAAAAASGARSRVAAAAAGQGPGRERRRPPRPGSPRPRLAQRGAGPRSPVPARGREAGRPAGRQPRPRCAAGFRPAPRLPPSAPLWCDPAGSGDPGRGRLKAHKPGGNNAPEGFGPEGCCLGAANCCTFLPELVFSAWLHARKRLLAGVFLPGFVSLLNGTGSPLQTKGRVNSPPPPQPP